MKRVLITGGSGFVGRKLITELLARGDHVSVFSRNARKTRAELPLQVRVIEWNPAKVGPWADELSVVDAVVHLAGENVAQRWTDKAKRAIDESRSGSTRVLVEAMSQAKPKPGVLVCASAVGYYGPRPGDEELDEESSPSNDFLANVVVKWEEAAREAEQHGIRSVQMRIGIVLGEGGGPLEKLVMPFKLGVGGHVGDGKQVISWVHRDDVVGMIIMALDNEGVSGPINVVSPNPVTGKEMADAIGVVMGKSSWLPVPNFALGLAMGEASVIVTTGQRVMPKRAVELGYEFHQARLVPALESILGKDV